MNEVNKTLYIPLFGKAYVSRRRLFLNDRKAEEIWAAEGFRLKGKSASKWLAFYMGVRAAVFDGWVQQRLAGEPDAAVICIGCGMDSRVLRVRHGNCTWYDVDFPDVIRERRRYFQESCHYRMISGNARDDRWLKDVPHRSRAIVVMEGVSMYLTAEEMRNLTAALCRHFGSVSLLTDCYTTLAARMSKYRNPVSDVGVTQVFGLDDPALLESGALKFVREHDMTPQRFIDELRGAEKFIFRRLYAGGYSRKLYRLFEYSKD